MEQKELLLKAVEKFVVLSAKSRELENEVSDHIKGQDARLINEFVAAVLKESEQSMIVRRMASSVFGNNSEDWAKFLGCAWSWAEGELETETALKRLSDLLNKR